MHWTYVKIIDSLSIFLISVQFGRFAYDSQWYGSVLKILFGTIFNRITVTNKIRVFISNYKKGRRNF